MAKKLMKAQTGKIVKPVKSNNTKVDSSKYYYDKAVKFRNDSEKILENAQKEKRYNPYYKGEGWKNEYDKDRYKAAALQDSAKKYYDKMNVADAKNRAAGKPHWAMSADTTAKKMGGSSSYKKGGSIKTKKKK